MRRRARVSHALSQCQTGEFDLIKAARAMPFAATVHPCRSKAHASHQQSRLIAFRLHPRIVLELGVHAKERHPYRTNRAVTLLADNNFSGTFVR